MVTEETQRLGRVFESALEQLRTTIAKDDSLELVLHLEIGHLLVVETFGLNMPLRHPNIDRPERTK